jgi:hypothetical protein
MKLKDETVPHREFRRALTDKPEHVLQIIMTLVSFIPSLLDCDGIFSKSRRKRLNLLGLTVQKGLLFAR